jgi:hypothetical protein
MALGGQLAIAFDAGSVSGALLSRGRRGIRVRAWAHAALAPGALEPGGVELNLVRPGEVREALAQVATELGALGRSVCLLLPAGVARTSLLALPGGVDPGEYALFKVGSRLPYPPGEAVVDGLAASGGAWLAAIVRRSVIAQYEAAAADVGLGPPRVDVAPLAGLAGLQRQNRDSAGIDVVLGDAALTLAIRQGAGWSEVRSRRRPRANAAPERIAAAVDRVSRLGVGGGRPPVRLVGPGAAAGAALLRETGHLVQAGWPGLDGPSAAGETAWLGGVA